MVHQAHGQAGITAVQRAGGPRRGRLPRTASAAALLHSTLRRPPHPPQLAPPQEKALIQLKREAKVAKGFYCEPEAKLAFVIRIRGLNKIHPKVSCRCCRVGGKALAVEF